MSGEWTRLCDSADVLPGEAHVAWFGDVPLLVVNHEGQFYALEDRCSHDDFNLSDGVYDPQAGQVECVLHGARFDVRSGQALCPPAYAPVKKYPVKLDAGALWVREPEA